MKTPTDSDRTFDRALTDSRAMAGELGNHAIDEFNAGRLTAPRVAAPRERAGLALAGGGVRYLAASRAHGAGRGQAAAARSASRT